MADEAGSSRRTALARLVNGMLAVIGGALASVLGVFAANPRTQAAKSRWVRAIALDELEPQAPRATIVTVPQVHGWYRSRSPRVVYLVWNGEEGDNAVRALSGTCTHLGCGVRWDAASEQFKCPCHGGVYDSKGRVIAGPPPRNLDELPVRIEASGENRQVMVQV